MVGLVPASLVQPWSKDGHANDPVAFLKRKSDLISENGVRMTSIVFWRIGIDIRTQRTQCTMSEQERGPLAPGGHHTRGFTS